MNQKEIFSVLKQTGLPVTYAEWPQGVVPALPYLVFIQDGDDRFLADDEVYGYTPNYMIELYSKKKDYETEETVKATLTYNKLIWQSIYEGRTDEGLYQSVFSI